MSNDKRNKIEEQDIEEQNTMPGVKNLNVHPNIVKKIIGPVVAGVLGLSVIGVGVLHYLGSPKSFETRTFRSMVKEISIDPKYTVLDEVLAEKQEESGDYLPATLDFINELTYISDEVHEFDLDSVVEKENVDLPDLDEIEVNQEYLVGLKTKAYEEIRLYKELVSEGVKVDSLSPDARKLRECVKRLYGYNQVINYILNGQAWDKTGEFSLAEFKASVANCMNESPEYIDGIKVYPDGDRRYVKVNDHGDEIVIDITPIDKNESVCERLFKTGAVHKFVNSIFDQQRNAGLHNPDSLYDSTVKYSKSNNDELRNTLNTCKWYMFARIEQNEKGNLVLKEQIVPQRWHLSKCKSIYKKQNGKKYGTN